jgi:hypothetical protein
MAYLLAKVWRTMRGRWQWYVLWLFHHKFIVGVNGVIFNDQGQILLLALICQCEGDKPLMRGEQTVWQLIRWKKSGLDHFFRVKLQFTTKQPPKKTRLDTQFIAAHHL